LSGVEQTPQLVHWPRRVPGSDGGDCPRSAGSV